MTNEYVDEVIKDLQESVDYFGSSVNAEEDKQDQEMKVVKRFLKNLGVSFDLDEIKPWTQDNFPDVEFRDTRFEIKTIVPKGSRMHEDYKNKLKKAEAADTLKDLLEPYQQPRAIENKVMYRFIRNYCTEVMRKNQYSDEDRGKTDLLFYVNMEGREGFFDREIVMPDDLSRFGFRSISFLHGMLWSGVYMAADNAPCFLKRNNGKGVPFAHMGAYGDGSW